MKSMKIIFNTFLVLSLLLVSSCDDVTEINNNPNGVDPNTVDPNLVMSTAMSHIGIEVVQQGFSDPLAAYVQYVQKDSWSTNDYDWEGGGWNGYYAHLRNLNLVQARAVELEWEFHQGVAMVLKAYLFGKLTDYYGDVPYTDALRGQEGGEYLLPKYDAQETVYKGIIADLRAASSLLSKDVSQYNGINASQDLFYGGDPAKWMKLANSLALRYYMRLSEKDPSFAGPGVTEMLNQPLITSMDDECSLDFLGITQENSWPSNGINTTPSDFWRTKPCSTFSYKLAELKDPRLHIWFAPVATPIKVVPASQVPGGGDDVLHDGVRYINAASMAGNNQKIYNPETWYQDRLDNITMIDTNSVYVGMPVSNQTSEGYTYNLNPSPVQGGKNTHVSMMNEQFNETSGPNLKGRVFSAAEIHFLMAEAAIKGWGSNAETHYYAGIQASLEDWGIGDEYDDYIDNDGVSFDGSLAMVMEQKWISNFTTAGEAYLDWRRTGLPDLQTGPYAKSTVIPVRFAYEDDDRFVNHVNYNAALGSLEETSHSADVQGYGVDSPWSKNWAQQGVSKPW